MSCVILESQGGIYMKFEVNYEQIIAGALLNFERLDPVDIRLLLDQLERTGMVEITACLPIHHLKNYITSVREGGFVSLNPNLSLDTFLEEENCSLREKMLNVCGKFIREYFTDFDTSSFYQEKKRVLQDEKDTLLTKGKVLLISDSSSEYEEVVNYGFLNVDYFKSLILADQYFEEHEEQLEKYHAILLGSQKGLNFHLMEEIDLIYKINRLRYENYMIKTSIHPLFDSFSALFENYDTLRSWSYMEGSYSKLLDHVVENSFINHTSEKIGLVEEKESIDFSIHKSVEKLALPQYKHELKILCLPSSVREFDLELARELGLSISFQEDNNFALSSVMRRLGEYDIIIATEEFSSSLSRLNEESSEQCLLTGRQLNLLLTYHHDTLSQVNEDGDLQKGFGEAFSCSYSFGGELASTNDIGKRHFRMILKDDLLAEKSRRKALIETSVSLYNDQLISLGCPLQDYDLNSSTQYDEAYSALEKKEQERKEEVLRPLQLFEGVRHRVEDYLWYKKEGFIEEAMEGLEIKENEEQIHIINRSCGKIICTMTFCRNYNQNNLRICAVQSITPKGGLTPAEVIGIYTPKYEQLENIPQRPNERQMNVLTAIDKKTRYLMDPLNKEGHAKYLESEKSKTFILKAASSNGL